MAKIFISFLGTSFYGECKYQKDLFLSKEPTRFIQEATLQYHKVENWSEDDKVVIFLTHAAKEKNWDVSMVENGQVVRNRRVHSTRDGDKYVEVVEDYVGLKDIIENMHLNAQVVPADLEPDYENKKDFYKKETDECRLKRVFNIVYDQLQDKDRNVVYNEIYFDVTHGYRYLPMFAIVLISYAEFMLKAKVHAITYGNYEAIDKATKIAPIVDLMPFVQLQKWTLAAASFVDNGSVDRLKRLNTSSQYVDQLAKFIDQMRFCRGRDVYSIDVLPDVVELSPEEHSEPLRLIAQKIEDTVVDFKKGDGALNCIYAAEWCFRMKQYQAAVTMLQEGVKTFFCEVLRVDMNAYQVRDNVSKAIMMKARHARGQSDENEIDRNVVLYADRIRISDDFAKNYENLNRIRNDFNHAGMSQYAADVDDLKRKIQSCIDRIKNDLRNYRQQNE